MSDKRLLNENTIRRFMKLANVQALTDNYISEMGGSAYKVDDDDQLEEADEIEMEADLGEVPEDAADIGPEDVAAVEDEADPLGDDADMGELAEADISLSEEEAEVLIALGERLKEAMASDEGAAVGDAAPVDAPSDDNDAMPEPDMAGEEEEEEEEELDKDAVVQEVLRRVARRLIRERNKN